MSSETQKQRINFASVKNPMNYPDFLEVQLKSFHDFLQLDTPPEKRKNDGLLSPTRATISCSNFLTIILIRLIILLTIVWSEGLRTVCR